MNLLNDCCEEATTEDKVNDVSRKRASSNLTSLRNCTVLAMSNLLNANIDSGLMHSIGKWLRTARGVRDCVHQRFPVNPCIPHTFTQITDCVDLHILVTVTDGFCVGRQLNIVKVWARPWRSLDGTCATFLLLRIDHMHLCMWVYVQSCTCTSMYL